MERVFERAAALDELARRPDGQQPPILHDADQRAEPLGLGQVMGREKDGDTFARRQALQIVA
jgi:hypothetical protein